MLFMAPLLASFLRPSAYPVGPLVLAPLLLSACAARVEPEPLAYPPATLDSTQIHSARTFLAAARNERAADNIPAAERLLTGLLEVHPYYAGAYTELVSLQLEVGNLSRAREALDGGLAIDPGNPELRRLEGAYYLASGDLNSALERYSELAEADKLNAKAQFNLALVQVMLGEDVDALQTLVGPLGPSRAKEKLLQFQQLRNQSGERPIWKPENGPGELLLAEPEPEPEPEPEAVALVPSFPRQKPVEPTPEPDLTDDLAAAQAADETLAHLEAALDEVEVELEELEAPLTSVDDPTGDSVLSGADEPEEEPVIEDWTPFDPEGSVAALADELAGQAEPAQESSGEFAADTEPAPEPVVVEMEPEPEPEEDPAASFADEPLELEPIQLGNPSTNPLASAKLDAPPVVAPQLPKEPVGSADEGPEAVVLAEPEPEPEPVIPAAPFVSSEWRGLAKSKIDGYGNLAIQRNSEVEIQMAPNGQHIVIVSRFSTGPVWVMGPKSDWLLSPDSRVRFLEDGSVFAGSGEREEFPAPVGRASAEDVWR